MSGAPDPDRFPYWRKADPVRNFGDYLTELYLAELFESTEPRDTRADTVQLVGSLIAPWYIRDCIHRRNSRRVVFWTCGLRDETPIPPGQLARSRFPAVRGPLTRDRLGLPGHTPIGDSALLLPLLHAPRKLPRHAGRSICVPHIADTLSEGALLEMTGADGVVRPGIPASLAALREMIDIIAHAEFVLAGALHAAICACAYGVPFSFLDTGFVDLPFKWQDFAASIGVAPRFAGSLREGREIWREAIAPAIRRPALRPLLDAAPMPVRPAMLARAAALDLAGTPGGQPSASFSPQRSA